MEGRLTVTARLDILEAEYQIADLAKEFGTTLRALRFYEQHGLVTPRRDGNRRFYSENDRRRLKLITFARRVDLSLAEIKELLDRYDQEADNSVPIQTILEKLTEHLQVLHDQREHIDWAISRLSRCIPVLQQKIA